LQPGVGLAGQARQPASFLGWQVFIVKQLSAMHNDPPFALDQEAANLTSAGGANHPDEDDGLVPVCNSNMSKQRVSQRNADRSWLPALRHQQDRSAECQ